jgi:hypothetical protein
MNIDIEKYHKHTKNFVWNFLLHVENYKFGKSVKLSDYVVKISEIMDLS